MQRSNYLLSIGLATRNRPDNLKRALTSLYSQSFQPFEVIISDDSNDEESISLNQALAEEYNCRYFKGPQRGLYANRNFIASKIRGTHLRTMDDDHTFPVDHLKICIEAIEKEPAVIWTIGEYQPDESIRHAPPHPIAGQLHPRGYSYVPKNLRNYSGISCGASIYPREIIEKRILNNESLPFGIMYLEYGLRLKSAGYIIKPLSETYIIHHNIQTFGSETQSKVILEARLYSMLKLSFYYEKTLGNMCKTASQIAYEILRGKVSINNLKSACKLIKNEYSA